MTAAVLTIIVTAGVMAVMAAAGVPTAPATVTALGGHGAGTCCKRSDQ